MSYVGLPFKHDLFLSYSHGDVEGSGQSRLKQWSRGFARALESELRAIPDLGLELKIFFDSHHQQDQAVDPMAPLTEQLGEDIAGSALLAVLMSPHYLRSKWCADERQWWLKAGAAHGVGVDHRVAVARIWETDAAQWPQEFKDSRGHALVGFTFYNPLTAATRPQPYDWPEPQQTPSREFMDALLNLTGHLATKLRAVRAALEEKRRASAEADKLAAPGGQLIYLHGRADHAKDWDRAADALSQDGYAVCPAQPEPVFTDPDKAQEASRERVNMLRGCDALMLVGAGDEHEVDADLVVVGRTERYSARSRSQSLLPCALLNHAGANMATPQRRRMARSLQVEWIESEAAGWTQQLRQWLATSGAALGAGLGAGQ